MSQGTDTHGTAESVACSSRRSENSGKESFRVPPRSRVTGVLDWVSIQPRRGRYVSLDPEEHAMSILPDLAGLCPSCGADDNVRWCGSAPDADTWGCTQCGSTWVINVDESGAATIAAMARG
jgi:hypothetical protein